MKILTRSYLRLLMLLILTSLIVPGLALSAVKTWIGLTTDWGAATNWLPSTSPISTDDPLIPTSPTGGNFPVLSSGTFTVHNITVQLGATFTISGGTLIAHDLTIVAGPPVGTVTQSGGLLQLGHDWRNSGTFNATAGTVEFTASAGGASSFATGANQFFNIIVDAGVNPNFDNDPSSSVLIRGDFTNNNTGLDLSTNATFTFNGTGTQSISSASTGARSTFGNLVVNKSTGGVTLSSSFQVGGTLTLTSGNITTGASILTLGIDKNSRGTLVRTSGTVIGNFKRWFTNATASNVVFPVGTAGNYRPANISFTGAPSAAGTLIASFTASNPGTSGLPLSDGGVSVINIGPNGFWTITAGNGLTGGTYSLDLTADGFAGVSNFVTLRLLKRVNSSSAWTLNGTHAAGTGSNSTPVVHRTGMAGFSEFGIGGPSDNPLPIQLASFTGMVLQSGNVQLTWVTLSEVNNYGFYVQRKHPVDVEYVEIDNSFVPGHGTTNETHTYSFTDVMPGVGAWMYRLRHVDLDGTVHYTEPIHIDVLTGVQEESNPLEFSLKQNYPNPFNPSTTIGFDISIGSRVRLKIYNFLGQEVATILDEQKGAGRYSVVWNGRDAHGNILPSGVYFYKITAGSFTQTRRLALLK